MSGQWSNYRHREPKGRSRQDNDGREPWSVYGYTRQTGAAD